MLKLNLGWFFVRYEDDRAEEWLRLSNASFNNCARGSWRVDLDFDAADAVADPAGKAEVGDDAEEGGDGSDGNEDDGDENEYDDDESDEDQGDEDEDSD